MKRTHRMSSVDDEDLLPLPDNALTTNLGLDLVVVVTKVTNQFVEKMCHGVTIIVCIRTTDRPTT